MRPTSRPSNPFMKPKTQAPKEHYTPNRERLPEIIVFVVATIVVVGAVLAEFLNR